MAQLLDGFLLFFVLGPKFGQQALKLNPLVDHGPKIFLSQLALVSHFLQLMSKGLQ